MDVLLSPHLLAFSRVSKRFSDGTVALSGVDLSVDAGEFVSILGPSSCGKSTLLRLAAGLSQVSEGTAQVGTDQIGYVFQDPTLLPWRTVQANVELFAELRHMPGMSVAAGPLRRWTWSACVTSPAITLVPCRAGCGCGCRLPAH